MRLVSCLALAALAIGCAARAPVARTSHAGTSKQARTVAPMIACSAPAECYVRSRTCCGACGIATPRDSIAINREWSETNAYACTGGSGCPDCFQEPDTSLVATCTRGACRVVSVSSGPLSRCTRSEDCVLRPTQCCECGASSWLAVRHDRVDAYQRLVCGARATCPQCVGAPPANMTATCDHGHCVASAPIGS